MFNMRYGVRTAESVVMLGSFMPPAACNNEDGSVDMVRIIIHVDSALEGISPDLPIDRCWTKQPAPLIEHPTRDAAHVDPSSVSQSCRSEVVHAESG